MPSLDDKKTSIYKRPMFKMKVIKRIDYECGKILYPFSEGFYKEVL